MSLEVVMIGSSGFLTFLLLVLLVIWAFKPNGKHDKKTVRKDLNSIKDQINGKDD